MCEADAYQVAEDQEALLMESVDIMEPEGPDTWRLIDIFGNQKIVHGRIKSMKLVDHKILFEKSTDQVR
jgi:predicted RNA-binding protein